jgi:mono/diheme cytochrome c family protein
MKGFVLGVVVALVAVASGVYVVSHFGWYPIGADNPPGRLEHMLASRAMDVYADKHKPDGDNPVAPTDGNLTDGARAYEMHCALCHGGAQSKISPLRDKFSPPPPQLINKIPHDPDAWIFWVTKHGVRMTGMPSWSDLLSDEDIWKIVAFIKHSNKLPPGVEAAWRTPIAAAGGQLPAPKPPTPR